MKLPDYAIAQQERFWFFSAGVKAMAVDADKKRGAPQLIYAKPWPIGEEPFGQFLLCFEVYPPDPILQRTYAKPSR